MAVLGSLFGGTYLATRGGDKQKKEQGPPINASSKDEEQFIQCVDPFLPFPMNAIILPAWRERAPVNWSWDRIEFNHKWTI